MTGTKPQLELEEPDLSFDRTPEEEPWHFPVPTTRGDVKPTQFTRVRIASTSGIRVFGVLRETVRGRIQVLTTIPVPVRCPLEITLEGCQPATGEAFYSIKRSSVFLIGIVFASCPKPSCTVGSVATIRDLESPFATCCGRILNVGNTSLSVLYKTAFPPGAWVRLEWSNWILFGVVRYAVPAGTAGRCVCVHLEAAFRTDSRPRKAIPETHILRSSPRLQSSTRMDRESPLQGDVL